MINIQSTMKELFSNSCCGYCYAYICEKRKNIEPDTHTLTSDFLGGWNLGYVDDDGFVSKPVQYLGFMGYKIRDIEKVYIKSLSELPEGLWTVEYKKNPDDKASHFVVCNKKKVIFDPSGESITVKVGQPVSYRKFIE